VNADLLSAECWIVDFDDTIALSGPAQLEAWGLWAERHGLDVAPYMAMRGCTARHKLETLAPWLDIDAELAVIEAFEIEHSRGVTRMPGAGALWRLPIRFGIGSSGTEPVVRERMKSAQLAWDRPGAIITATQVGPSKPDPAVYRAVAEAMGVDPARCAGFDDAPAGVEALKRLGCAVIVGVGNDSTREELEAAGATICVPHLANFIERVLW
jgi:sugar-phosphatase